MDTCSVGYVERLSSEEASLLCTTLSVRSILTVVIIVLFLLSCQLTSSCNIGACAGMQVSEEESLPLSRRAARVVINPVKYGILGAAAVVTLGKIDIENSEEVDEAF